MVGSWWVVYSELQSSCHVCLVIRLFSLCDHMGLLRVIRFPHSSRKHVVADFLPGVPCKALDPGWLWAVLPEDEWMNYGIDKVNLNWIMLPWIAQAAQMPKEHWTAVVKIFSNRTTCFINDTYGLKSYTWSPYACSFDTEWYSLLRMRVLQLLRGSLMCILPIRDSRNGRSGRQSRLSSGSSITDEDGIFINSASSKLLERAHGILM